MRLITWNCQGAFRKKAEFILKLQPNILIVQECEHPDRLKFADALPKPTSFYWHGDSEHKGIGIFSYSDYSIELLPQFDPKFRYILPLKVIKGSESFTLFAIWAMHDKVDRKLSYVMQIWQAIEHYQDLLDNSSILVGDFNSNTIWDRKGRVGNHSDLVQRLAEKNIHSIYHHRFAAEQGFICIL